MRILIKSDEPKEMAKFKKNGVELETFQNQLTIYSNNWCSIYEVKLNGRIPFLKLIGREKCYR